MPDGTFVIAIPDNLSLPARPLRTRGGGVHYTQKQRKAAQQSAADLRTTFQTLNSRGWKALATAAYDRVGQRSDGGQVMRVDAESWRWKPPSARHQNRRAQRDPAAKAGFIAERAGVTDTATAGCPVKAESFGVAPGGGNLYGGRYDHRRPMPKSGFAANTRRVVAAAITADLWAGRAHGRPCQHLLQPDQAGLRHSVAGVYRAEGGKPTIEPAGSGGVSLLDSHHRLPRRRSALWQALILLRSHLRRHLG